MTEHQSLVRRIRHYQDRLGDVKLVDRSRLHEVVEPYFLQRVFSRFDVDCVIDIGANLGQYAEMLRTRVNYQGLLVSIEPVPSMAAALREKAKADSRWQIVEIAVGERDGHAELNLMANEQFCSLSRPRGVGLELVDRENTVRDTVTVKAQTLSSLLADLRSRFSFERPFLKLDTQGLDVAIVRASVDAMQNFVGFQSELAIERLYESSTDFREALTYYESLGFYLSALLPNNGGHFPRLLEMDCVMIRSDLIDGVQRVGVADAGGAILR